MPKSISARSSGDKEGWKRGAGPYSRDYAKFDRPQDRTDRRSLGEWDEKLGAGFSNDLAYPGKLPQGHSGKGPPRYKPKTGPQTLGRYSPNDLTKGRK